MNPPIYYLDTSALIKRYVAETGSTWIRTLADPTAPNLLLTARLTVVEARSALARRKRAASISDDDHAFAVGMLANHAFTQYHFVELEGAVVNLAGDLLDRHPLRAYDAVQLASALMINSALLAADLSGLIFLTADDRLLSTAQIEGMVCDNPNLYP